MDCREFRQRIGEFVDDATEGKAHRRACADCARLLARARRTARVLSEFPREPLPESLRGSVFPAAETKRLSSPRFLLAAAALLLLAAVGTLALLERGPDYRPLELEIIDVDTSSAHDADLILEQIYGPGVVSVVANGER
jgi:hypothetical protein